MHYGKNSFNHNLVVAKTVATKQSSEQCDEFLDCHALQKAQGSQRRAAQVHRSFMRYWGKYLMLVLLSVLIALGGFYYFFSSPPNMVYIPGGTFLMGSNSPLAKAVEKPAHWVTVSPFWMDKTDVTNAQFAAFVKATGYVTTAEQKPDWETLKVQLPPGTPRPDDAQLQPGAMVFVGTTAPVPLDDPAQWWQYVPGANWRHPQGPNSTIEGKASHPVVQISYQDALAYAKWAHKRLPTEAEWEFAARGGLKQATYVWGDEFRPQGKSMANTFAGHTFPVIEPGYQNKIGTVPVASYPANGYGLYDMAGNVWQWVADWYRADAFMLAAQHAPLINPTGPQDSFDPAHDGTPANAPKRVIRGGSFLCDKNFCTSYRPSARRGVDPYNPMAHIGFRLVRSVE